MSQREYVWDWKNNRLIVGGVFVRLTDKQADLLEVFFADLNEVWAGDDLLVRLYGRIVAEGKTAADISGICSYLNRKLKPVGWKIKTIVNHGRRLVIAADCVVKPVAIAHAETLVGAQPADTAPTDGTEFIALLSNGKKVMMRRPSAKSEYYDYWDCDGDYCVPVADTICTESRAVFLYIIEWYAAPKPSAQAMNAVGVMRDSRYGAGDM